MSRTRGAATIAENRTLSEMAAAAREMFDEQLPDIQPESGAPELPSIVPLPAAYTCEPSTLDRNLEASELAEILAIVLGGWSITIDGDKWGSMRPDVRRHFKKLT